MSLLQKFVAFGWEKLVIDTDLRDHQTTIARQFNAKMGDSDDAQWLRRRLSKQFEKLDLKPENYQKIEMLARNCSTSVLESDGKPTNNDLDEKQIDFVASKDRNIFANETKVDNNKTENDEQAPNNKVEHKVIEIVASTDKNVSQNMINVNNNAATGEVQNFVTTILS